MKCKRSQVQISDNSFPGIKTILSFLPHVWNMDTMTRAVAATASDNIEEKARRTAKTSVSSLKGWNQC